MGGFVSLELIKAYYPEKIMYIFFNIANRKMILEKKDQIKIPSILEFKRYIKTFEKGFKPDQITINNCHEALITIYEDTISKAECEKYILAYKANKFDKLYLAVIKS